MVDFKLVLSTKDGNSYQKDVKSPQANSLLNKRLGETVSGDALGFAGYEFKITGGSDTSGFPMRKGILRKRHKILLAKGVGFSGKKRDHTNQPGIRRKKTVCGEQIDTHVVQVNLKVMKEGSTPFATKEEVKAEA